MALVTPERSAANFTLGVAYGLIIGNRFILVSSSPTACLKAFDLDIESPCVARLRGLRNLWNSYIQLFRTGFGSTAVIQ
jgi:hypothetical protein